MRRVSRQQSNQIIELSRRTKRLSDLVEKYSLGVATVIEETIIFQSLSILSLEEELKDLKEILFKNGIKFGGEQISDYPSKNTLLKATNLAIQCILDMEVIHGQQKLH